MTDANEILQRIVNATYSHIDGRDLLAELHPRRTLDIKRRVDAKETWFEGDWLSTLYKEILAAKAHLNSNLHRTRNVQESSRLRAATQEGSARPETRSAEGGSVAPDTGPAIERGKL